MLMMNWWSSSISFYFIYHYYYEVIFLKCICFLLERLLSWHPLTVITFFRLFFGIVGIWHSSLIPLSLMDDYWLYFIILYFCHSCLCLFSFFLFLFYFFFFLWLFSPSLGGDVDWGCILDVEKKNSTLIHKIFFIYNFSYLIVESSRWKFLILM